MKVFIHFKDYWTSILGTLVPRRIVHNHLSASVLDLDNPIKLDTTEEEVAEWIDNLIDLLGKRIREIEEENKKEKERIFEKWKKGEELDRFEKRCLKKWGKDF